MGALLAGLAIGVVIGAYAQDAFDLTFRAGQAWARFNRWRKG